VEQQFLWEGHDIVILGNRRNLWPLLSGRKHLRKNNCTASCSLLLPGAGPNSSLQFILYSCAYVLCTLQCTMGSVAWTDLLGLDFCGKHLGAYPSLDSVLLVLGS
jgi:hypothetical protein